MSLGNVGLMEVATSLRHVVQSLALGTSHGTYVALNQGRSCHSASLAITRTGCIGSIIPRLALCRKQWLLVSCFISNSAANRQQIGVTLLREVSEEERVAARQNTTWLRV